MFLRVCILFLVANAPALAAGIPGCLGLREPRSTAPLAHDFELFVSPYVHHWSSSPQHKPAVAFALNRVLPDDRYCGIALFRNSFGQPSAVVYSGWLWATPSEVLPALYGRITAGIMYGYVGQYQDKTPLNVGGFSPVIIPAIGYRLWPGLAAEMQILGNAAVAIGLIAHY